MIIYVDSDDEENYGELSGLLMIIMIYKLINEISNLQIADSYKYLAQVSDNWVNT